MASKIIETNKQIGKVFYGLMECNEGEFDISENFRFHSTWGANESNPYTFINAIQKR
jgi:hypothetical protein